MKFTFYKLTKDIICMFWLSQLHQKKDALPIFNLWPQIIMYKI